MNTPPSTPRFARPTAASIAKCSPKSSIQRQSSDRSRRSSTFPDIHRDALAIRPADHEKRCPLALLPTEIRLLIYNYILPQGPVAIDFHTGSVRFKGNTRDRWPAILRVCRLIRKEAAHEFYSRTPFEANIYGLELYSPSWISYLSKANLTSLAQNRNMALLVPGIIYPSEDSTWEQCRGFGNVYNINRHGCRRHFQIFCVLAKLWLRYAQHPIRKINWQYIFWRPGLRISMWDCIGPRDHIWMWLFDRMSTIALPCVQKNWTRTQDRSLMKKPALAMLDALDQSFKQLHPVAKQKSLWLLHGAERATRALEEDEYEKEWDARVRLLRKHLHQW